ALFTMDQEHRMMHEDAFRQAKAAAEKAVQLGPQSSEAYSALGLIRAQEYRWPEAEQMFRRAIELNPTSLEAHTHLGFHVLLAERRMDEAISEIRRAIDIDPLSSEANLQLAYGLFWAGRLEEAEVQTRKLIGLDSTAQEPYAILGEALSWHKQHSAAI